jgi:WhiB family transcriptional regulator, redox-sensing transcriptional regulator
MTNVTRLPGPIADIWDWQRLGLCRGRDSAQFFHPDGERGASRGRREAAAKVVCGTCPVRAQCAAHALTTREPYGIWGGFTENERLRLLATGWEDCANRSRTLVDVSRLEHRLATRPELPPPTNRSRPSLSAPRGRTANPGRPPRRDRQASVPAGSR